MSQTKEHVLGADLSAELASVAAPRTTKAANIRGKPERDKVAATFYVPRPTHKWLKQAALDRGTSLQQLLEEAVDEWLAKNNGPSFQP